MLTSFFGKSSPINFLLLGIFIVVFSTLNYLFIDDFEFIWREALNTITITVLLVFSMLLLDFIIRKNNLNKSNTFAIFVFSCIVVTLPTNTHLGIIIAQFFLLLAFRRMISFSSKKNIEKKILDATLWIALASYFYFWSWLLLGFLYFAIFSIKKKSVRYLLIPLIGIFGMLLIAIAFFLLKEGSFQWLINYAKPISLDFTAYGYWEIIVYLTFFFSILIWSVFYSIAKLKGIQKKFRASHLLVLISLAFYFCISFFSESKIVTELIFLASPSAIIIGNFLEKEGDLWFKEIILWIFLLPPIIFQFV